LKKAQGKLCLYRLIYKTVFLCCSYLQWSLVIAIKLKAK
jgi:hypothetical protein